MGQGFREKRRHLRLNSRIPIRYRRIEKNAQEFKGSLIRDISEGGTRMTIYEFLPLNSRLALEIPLASGTKPIQGVCRVAWIRKAGLSELYDVGLEFGLLNQGDAERIADFVFNKSLIE